MNRVDKIFQDLFELHKYDLITAILFTVNDVEASQSLQYNVLMKLGVFYYLFMKQISKHSIYFFLQTIQRTIIKHYNDWNDRVTCQFALGIFSFSLVYSKRLSLSPNIYLSSLLLSQSSQGQSFNVIQSQIKYFLKVANKSNHPKEKFHVYASDNLFKTQGSIFTKASIFNTSWSSGVQASETSGCQFERRQKVTSEI